MAFTTLEAVVAYMQSLALRTGNGLRAAPSAPPANNGVFPFCVSGIESINWDVSRVGEMQGLATFYTEFHHAIIDTARDYTDTIPFGLSYANKLWGDVTLGDKVETIRGQADGGRGVNFTWRNDMSYAGVATMGWYVQVDVKLFYILT